jgi:hypothetical protein
MSGLLYMTAIVVFFGWLVNCWERWSHNKNPLFFLQPCQATKKKILKSPLCSVSTVASGGHTTRTHSDRKEKVIPGKKKTQRVLYVVTIYRKYFRALTLENWCQDLFCPQPLDIADDDEAFRDGQGKFKAYEEEEDTVPPTALTLALSEGVKKGILEAIQQIGNKFSKFIYSVILCSKYTRALTFENFRQRRSSRRPLPSACLGLKCWRMQGSWKSRRG